MAAPTWTPLAKGGTDQTQKFFIIRGLLGLSGNYTNGTGIALSFPGILTSTGAAYTLPPTYTGPDGPGQGVPVTVWITSIAGYTFNYAAGFIRIWNGITEVATGTIPAAITAAGFFAEAEFLRG